MNTLYIIGNGFDIAHDLPTTYWHFRNFLDEHDWMFLIRLEELFGIAQIDVQDPRVNVKAWETGIKDKLWGSLEEKLACPDIDAMLSFSSSIVGQLDLEGGNWGIEDTMDSYWEDMYGFVKKLPMYVEQWANSIDLSFVVPRKRKMINLESGKVLTFNYTSTLEECYHVDPGIIEHVHGGLLPYTDEPPVMGHGDKQSIMSHRVLADEADRLYDEGGKSIENAIANYFENTLKDTGSIICQKSRFFQNLYDIDNVDVVGLSYSSVDFPYLQEVKNSVKSDACWTMCYYSDEDKENLKNIVERLEIDSKRIKCMHSDEYLDS